MDVAKVKEIIGLKKNELNRRTSDGVHSSLTFKKVRTLLGGYNQARPVTGFIFVVIDPKEIDLIDLTFEQGVYDAIDGCISSFHNLIRINHDLSSVSYETMGEADSNEVRRICTELSKDFCVFVLSKDPIHYFVEGDDVGELLFFTPQDQERFNEKLDISQLVELFDEYRVHLSKRDTYTKFFVSSSAKKGLHKHINAITPIDEKQFLIEYQHLLENKPEDRFREDLRFYLSIRIKGTVDIQKERILENFQRTDIFIRDEFGDLYLIEVKWVGTSIHAQGDRVGTSYGANEINPAAITQTIGYLVELFKHKKRVKLGYLVVFDARSNGDPDTYQGFDEKVLTEDQKFHFPRFHKINDFIVSNSHPN